MSILGKMAKQCTGKGSAAIASPPEADRNDTSVCYYLKLSLKTYGWCKKFYHLEMTFETGWKRLTATKISSCITGSRQLQYNSYLSYEIKSELHLRPQFFFSDAAVRPGIEVPGA